MQKDGIVENFHSDETQTHQEYVVRWPPINIERLDIQRCIWSDIKVRRTRLRAKGSGYYVNNHSSRTLEVVRNIVLKDVIPF